MMGLIYDGNFPPLLGEGQGGVGMMVHTVKHYTRETIRRSRVLRKNPTEAEKKLWQCLRKEQLEGYKFRRQFFIGKYIVDFVCVDSKLVIEADGGQHNDNHHDKNRDAYLRKQGYSVLRFWNNDVLQNIEGVVETIRQHLLLQTPPNPPLKGEGL